MYSTCLFCHGALGSNETIPVFPIGRRVAFDSARGRLWVVCTRCGRWNLSPVEERWEAIEAAERNYHDSRLRVATENIGLARLKGGFELIRIGSAPRLELTSWRYGSQIRSRRTKQYVYGTVLLAGLGVAIVSGAAAALVAASGGSLALQGPNLAHLAYRHFRVIGRLELENGERAIVRGRHIQSASLEFDGREHQLSVRHDKGRVTVEGPESVALAGRILTLVNVNGASSRSLREAVQYLDRSPTSMEAIRETARSLPGTLASLPTRVRLAMEIAHQDETERNAMEGDLVELEQAWREAEEIAAIADRLLVPDWLEDRLKRMRASR
jgi:hypothetical protein